MIPATNGLLSQDFAIAEQTSHTWYLDIDRDVVVGYTDGLDAIEQAIYLMLETERFQHVIFSWNYGAEFLDLYGQPMAYVLPEIKRRISEALLQDSRIRAVENFDFHVEKSKVLVTFTAVTIFGALPIQKAVAS